VSGPIQSGVPANIAWFQENHHYAEAQARLECYQNIRRSVEHEIRGVEALLDVGNGGFFNYDTSLANHVTVVDLFLPDGPGPDPNTVYRRGSVLELPFAGESFDCVLAQNLLHHVTGRTARENHANLDAALGEMYRCLRAGGKAVLIESTVNAAFHGFECLVFRSARRITIGGHPMTFQFTPGHVIRSGLAVGFRLEEVAYVPRGRWVLQFGYRWPSLLTPARPIKLVLTR